MKAPPTAWCSLAVASALALAGPSPGVRPASSRLRLELSTRADVPSGLLEEASSAGDGQDQRGGRLAGLHFRSRSPRAMRRPADRGENVSAGVLLPPVSTRAPPVLVQWLSSSSNATQWAPRAPRWLSLLANPNSNSSWIPAFDVDEFTIYYWGVVFLAVFVIGCSYQAWLSMKERNDISSSHYSLWNLVDPNAVFTERELTRNLWVFYLIVACGQAKVPYMQRIPVHCVGALAITMGCLQMFTVYLIVHDINPVAAPVTTMEAVSKVSPWKESAWSVNSMKWIQVIFITTALVKEIGQGMHLFSAGLTIAGSRLKVPRFSVLFMAVMQYTVTMAVLYGGVSIILSFQAVPDIIYSSMAITFIANVDDTLYEFCEQVFDIDADFVVDHSQTEMDSAGTEFEGGMSSRSSNWARHCAGPEELPAWYGPFRKAVVLFPCLFAFWLIGRAWHTDTNPVVDVRSAQSALSQH